MCAEQATYFLNSYVRGRLYVAKERMLVQGMWMGDNINPGYMVDDRKSLPSGVPNQNWRKYQLFEPCAEVVVKIFETFIMLGGISEQPCVIYMTMGLISQILTIQNCYVMCHLDFHGRSQCGG